MLDEAHGLSILDLWKAHPLHITLMGHLHLLLLKETRGGSGWVGRNEAREGGIRRDSVEILG